MKRICFDGEPLFTEISNLDKIEAILNKLLHDGDVECWFYGCKWDIMLQAVKVIKQMRKRNPLLPITIVDVVDPLNVDIDNFDRTQLEIQDDFPIGFVDRFVPAPLFDGKAEKNSNYFIAHQRKIRKWMFMQCDIVALYHYDLLPLLNISSVENMAKKGQIELIKIYDENTNDIIKEKVKTLEGEDRIFYDRRIEGNTYKEMADLLHVSVPRISQRTKLAIIRLSRIVRYELKRQGKLYQPRA